MPSQSTAVTLEDHDGHVNKVLPKVAALAVVVLLTGCSSGSASPTRSAPLNVRLVLPTHQAVAGSTVHADLVVTNTTSHPVLTPKCALTFRYVGLRRKGVNPGSPGRLIGLCPPPFRIVPGITHFPVEIQTTYTECIEPGGSSLNATIRACDESGSAPALPTGRYQAVANFKGLPKETTHAKPPWITLVGAQPES